MTPTRTAALARLEDFILRAGSKYARHRNFDHGPDDRTNISMLSPYLRHRLITEEEVTRAVLNRHPPRTAEKFLQEIAWRTYWKGWLEMRPTVWSDYLQSLSSIPREANYRQAVEGRTGIECFDTWTQELISHGYLHNHTRMWFASIWIFTLRLPWQLGAEFFMSHLMDADPASNTLSWRWVAGLHTPGKHYLARASNIEKYTSGRFNPRGQLNQSARPISQSRSYERQPLTLPENPRPVGRVGHLITPDDLSPAPPTIASIAILDLPNPDHGEPAAQFLRGAIDDTRQRLRAALLQGELHAAVADWVERERLDHLVCSRVTVGPWSDSLKGVAPPNHPFIHEWDRKLWPQATAGFFKLKKSLPSLHRRISGDAQPELF